MTLSARMWLFGAALPVLVLALVLLVADRLFHLALELSMDRALLAQAAVESVSLFDGPERRPHLHMSTSPLVESVRPFAPEGVLYGPDGREVIRYPSAPAGTEVQLPGAPGAPPELTTRDTPAGRVRQLQVTVRSPEGPPYTLRVAASLAQLDTSTTTFHWVAVSSTLVAALVLVIVQGWQGRRLRARLADLQRHLEAVQAGDLEQPLPPERERDELATLRAVLATATEKLKQAQDAQERLLADAAHELRTPLTVMRTSLDLALRRERSPDELKQALRDAREEVQRLALLATHLLDAVALGKGEFKLEDTDLAALAHDAVATMAAEAEARRLRARVEAPAEARAKVHASSVRQALDNLLSNALKFAPEGTEVLVTVKSAGAGWSLSVRDEGPGIPPAERDAVFEPFHRARGAKPGTGLGLTIVREVARHHGGRAFVSDTAKGAEVVVELPARTAPTHP